MTDSASAPSGAADPTGAARPLAYIALAVCLVGELLDALDALITTVGGPTIIAELGGDGSTIQWLAAGYTIAMAAGLLIGGRLGDMLGRRRIFLIGMGGFALASLTAALAPSILVLILARFAQGLLGAIMVPQTFGMYRDLFPAERLKIVFGLVGPVMSIAGLAGPLAAGLILNLDLFGLGWRALFAVNLPFVIAAILIGLKVLPKDRPDRSLSLDWGSAALAGIGLPAILMPLVEGRGLGWPLWCFAVMALGVLLMVLFVRRQGARERSGRTALVEASLFSNRTFLGGLVFGVAAFGAGMCVGQFVALYAQLGLGIDPFAAGLLTIPDMIGMLIGMTLVSRLGTTRRTMLLGTLGMLAGSLALLGTLGLAGAGITAWALVPSLALIGIGSGLTMGPYFDMVMTAVSERETGSASGTLTAAQQVSAAFGIAAFGSVFFGVAEALGGTPAAFETGLEWTLGAIALVLVIGVWTLRLLPARAAEHGEEDAPIAEPAPAPSPHPAAA